jgi:hypothetical protein
MLAVKWTMVMGLLVQNEARESFRLTENSLLEGAMEGKVHPGSCVGAGGASKWCASVKVVWLHPVEGCRTQLEGNGVISRGEKMRLIRSNPKNQSVFF